MSDPFTTIDQFIKELLIGLGLDAAVTDIALNIVGAVVLGSVVGAVAILLIWAERKLVARIQDRIGPNRVGPYGLLQTIADALKLITKEVLIPKGADRYVFIMAPMVVVAGVIGLWAVMPLAPGLMVDIGIEEINELRPGEPVPVRAARGVVALDGEREIEFSPADKLIVRLAWDGPLTLDIARVMAYAAENGLMTRMAETSRHAKLLGD